MSVLINCAIFPTDKGDKGSSEYVSKVIAVLADSGVNYQLNAMGTVIETDTIDQALDLIRKSYEVLEPFSNRIYCTMTMDIRKGRSNGMKQKIESIEKRIGKVNT